MSEIQRFDEWESAGGKKYMQPWPTGEYVRYTDLRQCQQQVKYHNLTALAACLLSAVLLLVLALHKHDPQPVAKVAIEETGKKTELLNDLKARHEQAVANVETANKVYHSSAKDLERIKGLLELNANLKAQLIEQNKHLTPQQQTERLNAAGPAVHGGDRYASAAVRPTKMHDGQVAQLAREVGFTKIRVVE